jgi:hypothetical protein
MIFLFGTGLSAAVEEEVYTKDLIFGSRVALLRMERVPFTVGGTTSSTFALSVSTDAR